MEVFERESLRDLDLKIFFARSRNGIAGSMAERGVEGFEFWRRVWSYGLVVWKNLDHGSGGFQEFKTYSSYVEAVPRFTRG